MTDRSMAVRETMPIDLVAAKERERVDLIRRTVAKDATDDELALFLHRCKQTGLDPLAGQIHFVKRQGKGTIQTGIDGFRLIADRTNAYAGNDEPVFEGEGAEHPDKATVTVWKIVQGVRCPFTASARWGEYVPNEKEAWMWRKMPTVMLGKCAEAQALRKAFPADLSGLYVTEEMQQAGQADSYEVRAVVSEQPALVEPAKPQATPNRQNGTPAGKADIDWIKVGNLYYSQAKCQQVYEQVFGEARDRGIKGQVIASTAPAKTFYDAGKLLRQMVEEHDAQGEMSLDEAQE